MAIVPLDHGQIAIRPYGKPQDAYSVNYELCITQRGWTLWQ